MAGVVLAGAERGAVGLVLGVAAFFTLGGVLVAGLDVVVLVGKSRPSGFCAAMSLLFRLSNRSREIAKGANEFITDSAKLHHGIAPR